ncbi:MAG: hypothetical protein LBH90_07765 [Tannerella sp.]|nr:hypothetical protein [Tannerella sp.]
MEADIADAATQAGLRDNPELPVNPVYFRHTNKQREDGGAAISSERTNKLCSNRRKT